MHAPRRSHALSRPTDTASAATTGATVSSARRSSRPLLRPLASEDPSRHLRKLKDVGEEPEGTSPPLSPTAPPSLSIAANARAAGNATPLIKPQRLEQPSPREMWRAPTPRPVPLPALLPAVTDARGVRSPRRQDRPLRSTPIPVEHPLQQPVAGDGRLPSLEAAEGYGEEEYVRLVFDTDLCTPSSPHSQGRHVTSPGTVHTAPRRHEALPSTEAITSVQAAAQPAPALVERQQRHSQSSTPPAGGPGTAAPPTSQSSLQPEAWWSTLDGTLSANASPLGTLRAASSGVGGGGGGGVASLAMAQLTGTQNLNDTLGRADRAAMVLSVSYSQQAPQGSPAATAAVPHATVLSSDGDGGGAGAEDAVAAAVAALAARLTRTGEGSYPRNAHDSHHTASERAAHTHAGQNALQELRDTLRLTDVAMLSPHEYLNRPDDGDESPLTTGRHSTGVLPPSLVHRGAAASTLGAERPVPLVSIVKPQRQRNAATGPRGAAGERGTASATVFGAAGPGSKRTRDALARLYASPDAFASVAATEVPSGARRGLSFLHRPAPSIAAPAPPVSTNEAMRSLPQHSEPLSVALVERRFGQLEAAHTASHRLTPAVPGASPRSSRSVAKDRRGNAASATPASPRGREQPPSPQRRRSSASSVSIDTAAFSCVSLSSSIFLRELGDGEALRKSYMMAMGDGAAAGQRARGQPRQPSRAAPKLTPQQEKEQQLQRGAAVEEYRREQQRLYASHLATADPARAAAGGVRATEESALEAHLDVDYLFSKVTPRARNDGAGYSGKTAARVVGKAAEDSAGTARGSPGLRSPCSAATPEGVSSGRPAPQPRDALQEALAASQALLRRHIQDSPAWERLLYKVRQWCDRAQVMVYAADGTCVEQSPAAMAGRPAEAQLEGWESPSGRGGMRTQRDISGSRRPDGTTGGPAAPAWSRCNYADDPAEAHDALMRRMAEEADEVQRQNALLQVRQRQQQREATLQEASIMSASELHASTAGHLAGSSHHASGFLSTWAKAASRAEASSMHHSDDESSNVTYAPVAGSYRYSGDFLAEATATVAGVAGPALAKGPAPSDAARVSVVSTKSQDSRPLRVQHAALFSKLQTWGDDRDDGVDGTTDATEREGGVSVLQGLSAQADGAPLPLALVPCTKQPVQLGGPRSQRVARRSPVAAFDTALEEGEPSATQAATTQRAALPSRQLSRHGTFRLPSVERDLLGFVLTCGSSNPSSSGASSKGLQALLQTLQVPRAKPVADGGTADAPADAQQALAAVQCLLHSGFGVPLPLQEDSVLRLGEGGLSLAPSLEASGTLSTGRAAAFVWELQLTAALDGFDAHDVGFLRGLHLLLWHYDHWRQEQQQQQQQHGAERRDSARSLRRRPEVTIVSMEDSYADAAPRLVMPVTLSLRARAQVPYSTPSVTGRMRNGAGIDGEDGEEEEEEDAAAADSVVVDAADLFCALANSSSLLSWLMEAQRSSPTSTWMEVLEAMPGTLQQQWRTILEERVAAAKRAASASSGASHTGLAVAAASGHSASPPPSVLSFRCITASAVRSSVWRQRTFHDCVRRALASMAAARQGSDVSRSSSAVSPAEFALSSPPSEPFPLVGSTPYLPDEEGRANFALDMRNGYFISSLASEDVESRVAPQLREVRRQYADAVRAARADDTAATAAAAAAAGSASVSAAKDVSSTVPRRGGSTSLTVSLQQRVHVYRLAQAEQRFANLLALLWTQERTIVSFNRHVAAFNAFMKAEQLRWGPLYRSALTVAYSVCAELAEKKMENLSPDLLPFVSVTATFLGCRGGHRELRAKLPMMMVELEERAKRVQVHLDTVAWQGKRAQVLAEAVAAAELSPRRAGAVVSGLATEADVIGVPLTEVALPALQLKSCLPLPPAEE